MELAIRVVMVEITKGPLIFLKVLLVNRTIGIIRAQEICARTVCSDFEEGKDGRWKVGFH